MKAEMQNDFFCKCVIAIKMYIYKLIYFWPSFQFMVFRILLEL